MFQQAAGVYHATKKRHDQLWNAYVMRPIAAALVALVARTPATPNQLTLVSLFVFVAGAVLLVALPSHLGGLAGVLVLELSYLFDCADGMLARWKKIASKEGHLFDFFTDESKATMLVAALGLRLYRAGGFAPDLAVRPPLSPLFLVAGVLGVAVIASAISMTNFLRRPELTGKETPVEAHYETVAGPARETAVQWLKWAVTTFLRFLNHYPSHLWIFAALGRLDAFFWMYLSINGLYLARGWVGIVVRFGRPA